MSLEFLWESDSQWYEDRMDERQRLLFDLTRAMQDFGLPVFCPIPCDFMGLWLSSGKRIHWMANPSDEEPTLCFAMLDVLKRLMDRWRPIYEYSPALMTIQMQWGYVRMERFMHETRLMDFDTRIVAYALIDAHKAGLTLTVITPEKDRAVSDKTGEEA